jgi:hypothetical protein
MKMKNIWLLLILELIAEVIVAQNNSNQNLFTDIEPGSKHYYILRLRDGTDLQARIISIDNVNVLLLDSDGKSISMPRQDILGVKQKEFKGKGSIGLGFGIPYGGLGINAELPLHDLVHLSGGIGTAIYVTPIANVGSRIYLRSGDYRWRPRFSAFYGHNCFVFTNDINETISGITLGIGQQFYLGISKSFGFDFDVLFITNQSKFEKRIEELEEEGYSFDVKKTGMVKLSLGVRYCF